MSETELAVVGFCPGFCPFLPISVQYKLAQIQSAGRPDLLRLGHQKNTQASYDLGCSQQVRRVWSNYECTVICYDRDDKQS